MYSCILLCLLASVSVDVFGNSWEWVSFTGSECPSAASVEVIEQSGNTALVEMNLEGVYTQERRGEGRVFHSLNIPQSDWMQEPGKPKLPIVRTLLKIPSDTDVEVQVESDGHIRLDGYVPYPAGKKVVRRSHGELSYIDEEFAFDHALYSGDAVYPQNIVDVSFPGHLRQQRLALLEFHPIRYDPRSAELICHYSIQVRLSYASKAGSRIEIYSPESTLGSSYLGTPGRMMAPSASAQSGNVEYPDTLAARCAADYLIIAPKQFYIHDKVRELAEWRAQYSGLDVAVVSTAQIYDEFGNGTAEESIRSFIQNAYNSWRSNHMPDAHVGYVVLVGDVEFIPAHLFVETAGFSIGTEIATDNRYACVSGDDFIPDVMLGRLPVKNTEELSSLIDKIIQYEREPLYGDWANNALLAMGTIEEYRADMEYAKDEYLLPAGYSVSELSVLDGDGPTDVALAINEGQHIVDYAGHGWRNGWEIFLTLDMPMLNNGRRSPVIFSAACSTGYFDDPDSDCFGEKMLKAQNGAIAFFGASRIGRLIAH